MLDTTLLQIRSVQQQKMDLIDEYVKSSDKDILKEIQYLDDREKALISKQIVEGIK